MYIDKGIFTAWDTLIDCRSDLFPWMIWICKDNYPTGFLRLFDLSKDFFSKACAMGFYGIAFLCNTFVSFFPSHTIISFIFIFIHHTLPYFSLSMEKLKELFAHVGKEK